MTIDICKVCELVDNDKSKKQVEYCMMCGANICNVCKPNLIKRAEAAAKQFMLNRKRNKK